MDKAEPVPPDVAAVVESLVIEIGKAFLESRADFDAWGAPDYQPTPVSLAQQALIRARATGAEYHGDHVEALHLIGALGAMVGGGGADRFPDRVGAMMMGLALTSSILSTWRLSIEPLLRVADMMVPPPGLIDEISIAGILLSSSSDLVLAVTIERPPGRSAAQIEEERRALFCALGNVATAILTFARRNLDPNLKAVEIFAEAAAMAWT